MKFWSVTIPGAVLFYIFTTKLGSRFVLFCFVLFCFFKVLLTGLNYRLIYRKLLFWKNRVTKSPGERYFFLPFNRPWQKADFQNFSKKIPSKGNIYFTFKICLQLLPFSCVMLLIIKTPRTKNTKAIIYSPELPEQENLNICHHGVPCYFTDTMFSSWSRKRFQI